MQYQMSFQDSIRVCLQKYADFKGRASRAEYWWFYLFSTLLMMALGIVSDTLSTVASFALLLPNLSVTARRLHDRDLSGWWMLLPLTIIGIIPFIWFMLRSSEPAPNRYGDVPCRIS